MSRILLKLCMTVSVLMNVCSADNLSSGNILSTNSSKNKLDVLEAGITPVYCHDIGSSLDIFSKTNEKVITHEGVVVHQISEMGLSVNASCSNSPEPADFKRACVVEQIDRVVSILSKLSSTARISHERLNLALLDIVDYAYTCENLDQENVVDLESLAENVEESRVLFQQAMINFKAAFLKVREDLLTSVNSEEVDIEAHILKIEQLVSEDILSGGIGEAFYWYKKIFDDIYHPMLVSLSNSLSDNNIPQD